MWGKVLAKVGEAGLVYCSTRIPRAQHQIVPGQMGWEFLPEDTRGGDAELARVMLQNALICAVHDPRWHGTPPSVAFITEGPYAVPVHRAS